MSHDPSYEPMEPIELRQAGSGLRVVALVHGVYYLVTGIWPLIHMPSFELISGPKREHWLVRAAGALIAVIGGVLLLAGWRRQAQPETPLLGIGSAAALGAIDTVYAVRRVISRVYLGDAVVEACLIAGWIVTWLMERRAPRKRAAS